jgi:hypothetical protein
MSLNNSEIPQGGYCYKTVSIDRNGNMNIKSCPYWQKTKNGARCNLLNINSENYSTESLIWDSTKECDINSDDDNDLEKEV